MDEDIRADKSNAIPLEDFLSDRYVLRKKCLVVFISHPAPMGSRLNEKKIKTIEDESSYLDGEDVDVDIFGIHNFINKLPQSKRPGMKPDFKLMRNHKLHEIDAKLQELETKGHQYGSFIFVILTYVHTERDEIQVYGRGVLVDHFFDTIKSFESMAGKPKLFLIQADDLRMLKPTTIIKAGGVETGEDMRKIPTDADRIILMSTIPQDFSNLGKHVKRTYDGEIMNKSDDPKKEKMSLLVQAFIDVLTENPDTDFLSNTPLIVGKVDSLAESLKENMELDDYKDYDIPVPVVTSTLTKKLFLSH
ncbi:uncharacterized protein LOC128243256 isoform X2 [Mya arenaria]|nr:uncharacterized protein LOC128243256 isoform X2 [Mya arenaria]